MLLAKLSKPATWHALRLWGKPNEHSAFARLSDMSNLSATARYRHIQSLHENNDRRNPDMLAGAMMTTAERKHCLRLNAFSLMRMRRSPYYYYSGANQVL